MSDQEREAAMADSQTTPAIDMVTEEDRALLEKYSRSFTGTFAHTLDGK